MATLGEVLNLATLRGAIMGKIWGLWVFRLLENAIVAIVHLKMLSDADAYYQALSESFFLSKYFYTIVC